MYVCNVKSFETLKVLWCLHLLWSNIPFVRRCLWVASALICALPSCRSAPPCRSRAAGRHYDRRGPPSCSPDASQRNRERDQRSSPAFVTFWQLWLSERKNICCLRYFCALVAFLCTCNRILFRFEFRHIARFSFSCRSNKLCSLTFTTTVNWNVGICPDADSIHTALWCHFGIVDPCD